MSDEETTRLPQDGNKVPTTHPMLEAILARMNDGFAELNAKMNTLSVELAEFRAETTTRFEKIEQDIKRVDRKFEILTSRQLETEARQREVESRLDDLERKAS